MQNRGLKKQNFTRNVVDLVCEDKDCSGQGTCQTTDSGYICICNDGFVGQDCKKRKYLLPDSYIPEYCFSVVVHVGYIRVPIVSKLLVNSLYYLTYDDCCGICSPYATHKFDILKGDVAVVTQQ